MSNEVRDAQPNDERRAGSGGSTDGGPAPELINRLGYLLKHAQLRLAELTAQALAPYGISGRELAVLLVLAGGGPASQQEAAARLGIDRTTMVAFLDTLEGKGLVARQPDPGDRRRNVLALTETGQQTLRDATRAGDEAERQFLAPLTRAAGDELRRSLATVVRASR
jgi:DNA-binding MarR family transcriptional regulator